MADNHDYCRLLLRFARIDAKESKRKIPRTSSCWIGPEHYAVFLGNDWYREYGACCAFYARAEAIAEYYGDKPSDRHTPH